MTEQMSDAHAEEPQTGAETTPERPPVDPRKVSFIGLGVMGGEIARHIAEAGHELTIYNRSPDRLKRWQEENPGLASRVAANPAHAALDADVVITCVGNDDDLADVVLGPNGAFRTMRKGSTFIDHTTVSARIARQISVEARDLQIQCVDAPMTGSPIGAEQGTLGPALFRWRLFDLHARGDLLTE